MAWRQHKPRLLVIDDEEAILLAVRDYFSHRGFDVSCARDPIEAGKHLDEQAYDGVIADLRLSGSDGLEGLRILQRVRARSPRTRTLIVTAFGSREAEREARRHGVDAFLHKPVPLAEIARVVAGLMGEKLPRVEGPGIE